MGDSNQTVGDADDSSDDDVAVKINFVFNKIKKNINKHSLS